MTLSGYGALRSLDDYFQESGRCGRSGDNGKSVVYWKPSKCPARKELRTTHDTELMAVRRYLENTLDSQHKRLLAYVDPICAQSGKEPSHCCDVGSQHKRLLAYVDPICAQSGKEPSHCCDVGSHVTSWKTSDISHSALHKHLPIVKLVSD